MHELVRKGSAFVPPIPTLFPPSCLCSSSGGNGAAAFDRNVCVLSMCFVFARARSVRPRVLSSASQPSRSGQGGELA